jgi:hypothetical protein
VKSEFCRFSTPFGFQFLISNIFKTSSLILTLPNLHKASVCGRRAEKVKHRWRDGRNGAGAQRRRRAADGSPLLMRPNPIAARDERAV